MCSGLGSVVGVAVAVLLCFDLLAEERDHYYSVDAYLIDLTTRISGGLGRYPDAWRECHAQFIRTEQHADGGFCGREGAGDLYYSGFALRSLAVLGALSDDTAQRSAKFLQQNMTAEASIVDFFSLLYGATLLEMAAGVVFLLRE